MRAGRQLRLPVTYKGLELADAYRLDLLVEGLVIVEIKAVQTLTSLHTVQLLTYLRFTGARLGLLLNFHTALMRDGIRRVVNGLKSNGS